MFEGGYHGGVLFFAPAPLADQRAVPTSSSAATTTPTARDADRASMPTDLAAVLVEPMQGTAGCIPAEPGFLQRCATATAEHGVVLIFDEVMTSRLSPGGLQLRPA